MNSESKTRPRLVLIDGSGFVYRAYYALPRLTTRDGKPTGAVYGFIQMLNKIMRDFEYDGIVVAFDTKAPTFRHALFEDYKKSRPPMPPELTLQMPYIRKACEALGIPVVEQEGYEADDLIAILAREAVQNGYDVLIVTQDKDMLQLLEEGVKVYHPLRDRLYDRDRFIEEYGFEPKHIRDYLALVGDKVDEVPGVRGVGEKTALNLIRQWGSLEAIYEHLNEVPDRFRKKLETGREMAFLSRDLVKLAVDGHLPFEPSQFRRRRPDQKALQALLHELEFFSLLNDYLVDIHSADVHYQNLADVTSWERLVEAVRARGRCGVAVVYEGDHPIRGRLVGLAISPEAGQAWVARVAERRRLDRPGWTASDVRPLLAKLFEDSRITVYTHDHKTLLEIFEAAGLPLNVPVHDVMLMAYLLDPGRSVDLERMATEHLLYRMINPADVRPGKRPWSEVELPVLVDFLGERADIILQLGELLLDRIRDPASGVLWSVYTELELPLVPVLVAMEQRGIKVDIKRLKQLAGDISKKVSEIQEKIYEIVGFHFNLNSSKQLAKVLFEHLGLQPAGRTRKTRQFSTRMEVLEELATRHEVPRLILMYRSLAKTKATFVDALLHYADPVTHRVHARFHQAVTATGRLSSSDPNLQNIPVRDELGDALRDSFVAADGHLLVAADYSQIELRILAHMSDDPGLMAAFRKGEDVHTRTAAQILGKAPDAVSADDRRLAKAVNYGIAYGLSAFGLSQQTGMDVHEAQAFIDRYFETFPGVRRWIEKTLARAREKGYVETLFGRRRYIPDINSRDYQARQAAERQAVNMPVQGTAADLMKRAMIRLHKILRERFPRAALLLQVHDELVFEVPEADVDAFMAVVRDEMEHVYALRVPMEVDIHAGPTWLKAKQAEANSG